MKKRVLTLFLCLAMAFCMVCPSAFAVDSESVSGCDHEWVVPTDHYYSVPIPGEDLNLGVEVEQCSKCGLYKHTADYLVGKSTYYSLLPPHYNGLVPSELLTYWGNKWFDFFGKNATAKKFTAGGGSTDGSGVGRRPAGYADDNGAPSVSSAGEIAVEMPLKVISIGSMRSVWGAGSFVTKEDVSSLEYDVKSYGNEKAQCQAQWFVSAPYAGVYKFYGWKSGSNYTFQDSSLGSIAYLEGSTSGTNLITFSQFHNKTKSSYSSDYTGYKQISAAKGDELWAYSLDKFYADWVEDTPAPHIVAYCVPVSSSVKQQTNITINNNTWNGNIYTDNSTNLTYIYPEYTTINENNETVTNISTNPIIYNSTTNQYYTYDTVTNNYYYITYETTPTPSPSPSPTPAPTWTPGGGATRGGGVSRHPYEIDKADWTLHYYILNNRRYDAYYALKKTEVNTETKLPWVDNKKYISTTQLPIANGQYTVSVPDGVYWRVWQWDEASQTLTGLNSSNWHSTINNFLFNATGEYIFEFCRADGSDFDTAKDVTLKLKNDKITDYEDGGTIVEEPTPSPSPEPTETPSPTEPPTPTATPNPGGGTVPTPGGDSGGGNSGSSDSGWNPFKWLTDLLKDIVETILKGLWKLLTSIFGFILWLLSLLFKLFPWMPNSGILALCAGVVVVTIIRIIKFITGR